MGLNSAQVENMGDVLDFQESRVRRLVGSSQLKAKPLRDALADTVLATGHTLRMVPMNREMPYLQTILLGADYPQYVVDAHAGHWQPWFMGIEIRYPGVSELAQQQADEGWVTRRITTFEEAEDLLQPTEYLRNFTEDGDRISPWFGYAFTFMAALMYSYGLDFRSITITAHNVLQLKMVGDGVAYQIDLEGPTLHECHMRAVCGEPEEETEDA